MPASPRAIAFSIAVIWPASSPSSLPAAKVSSTPASSAAASAPSCIATKNGFATVLTMSETPMASPSAPPPVPPSPPSAGAEHITDCP